MKGQLPKQVALEKPLEALVSPKAAKLEKQSLMRLQRSWPTLKCFAFWCCTSVGSSENTLSQ